MVSRPSSITDYHAVQAAAMSEKVLMAWVLETARQLNWLVYHTHDSRRSEPGFPDLVMCRKAPMIGQPSELLVVELKTQQGRTTRQQDAWLDHFRSAGIETAVWRPAQWLSGEIVARLGR